MPELIRETIESARPRIKPMDKNPIAVQPKSNDSNNKIEELRKGKEALKHIVKAMVNNGYSKNVIKNTLLAYNKVLYVYQNLTSHDIDDLIKEILSDKDDKHYGLTDQIQSYIETTQGEFTLRDVCDMTGVGLDKAAKNKTSAILCKLVKEKKVERVGRKNGVFRKVDDDLNIMDFLNAEEKDVQMWLPFGLHDKVEIHPGNIILLAGEPNSGKTALMFNIIRYNQDKFNVHYFNSEMGATEMKKRLKNFDDMPLSDWKFNAYERADNFADVIVPGEGNINIIDYLEVYDEFFKVGSLINDIHKKLDGAIAVICMQKDYGRDVGRGGMTTLEKPRLALAIKPNKLKIVKAKNFKGGNNPNGQIIKYKLYNGCWLSSDGDWYYENRK